MATEPDLGPQGANPDERFEGNCHVALTDSALDILAVIDGVRSPKAGAIVLFAGTSSIPPFLVRSTGDSSRRLGN
jgi:hypothetical protein